MRRLNQKGLSVVYVVIAVTLLIGAGVFTYLRVSNNKKAAGTATNAQSSTGNKLEEQQPVVKDEFDPTITKLENVVSLIKVADVDKLPEVTPDGFITYMKAILQTNTTDEYGCITAYTVSIISQVNIKGSLVSVNPNTGEVSDGCGGGAAMFWYLKDGKWDKLGTQAVIPCTTNKETTLYGEFVDVCYEENPDYKEVPNPNGSIKNANL